MAGLAGLVILLCLLAYGLLQTSPVTSWLASTVSKAASNENMQVEITDIGGSLPFSPTLGNLRVSDKHGVFLSVENFHLGMSLGKLFSGEVFIEDISASLIDVERAPDLPPSPEPEPASSEIAWPVEIPSLPSILVNRIELSRIRLGPQLAGNETILNMTGRAEATGKIVQAKMDVKTLSGSAESLGLDAVADLGTQTLDVNLEATEEQGGLVDTLAKLPGEGGFNLKLAGSGPFSDFKANLMVKKGEAELVSTDIGLKILLDTTGRIDLALNGYIIPPAGLLPPDQAALVGNKATYAVQASVDPVSGLVDLSQADVAVAVANVSATAKLESDAKTITAKTTVTVPALSAFDKLAGQALTGDLTVVTDVSGTIKQPLVSTNIDANGLGGGGVSVKHIALQTDLALLGELEEGFPGLTVKGKGRLSGVHSKDMALPGKNDIDIALDVSASKDMAVTVSTLRVSQDNVLVDVSGSSQANGDTDMKANVSVPRIQAWANLFGVPLAGVFDASATVTGNYNTMPLAVNATVNATKLTATGESDLAKSLADALAAINSAVNVTLVANMPDKNVARLEKLNVKAGQISTLVTADYRLDKKTVDAVVKTDIASLKPFSAIAKTPLDGAVKTVIKATGPVDAIAVTAEVNATKIAAAQNVIDSVKLQAKATGLPATPTGNVSVSVVKARDTLDVSTQYALKEQRLKLSNIAVGGAGVSLSGNLDVDLGKTLISGTLNGGAKDLSGVGQFAQIPLSGSFSLDVKLSGTGGGQNVAAKVGLRNVTTSGVEVENVDVAAQMSDVLRAPRGTVAVSVAEVAAGTAIVHSLALDAKASGKQIDFTVATNGTAMQDFTIKTAGNIRPGETISLGLTQIQGNFGDFPLALTQPSTLTMKQGKATLSPLKLTFGDMAVTAQGGVGPGPIDFQAKIENFTLEMLALAGVDTMSGRVDVNVTMAGTGAKPTIDVVTTAKNIKAVGLGTQKTPAAAARATVHIDSGKLDMTAGVGLKGSVPAKPPLSVTASVPLSLSLAPFAFDLPQSGALSGTLLADLDLSELNGFLAAAQSKAKGPFAANFTLAGTIAEPAMSGQASLQGGEFDTALTGTVLRNMKLDLQASSSQITLKEFSATDGAKGTLRVTADIGLDPDAGFPMDLAVAMQKATLMRSEIATAQVDGNVGVKGSLKGMDVTGNLTVGPAEITLPDTLPPGVTTVDVVYVGPGAEQYQSDEASQKGGGGAVPINLDVKVDLPGRVFVRGLGLDSEWKGNISVTGTGAEPIVTGIIELVRGRLIMFDRTLTLKKGTIRLTGNSPPNPSLDIEASTMSGDVEGIIKIQGTALKPEIVLSSDPVLPRDEVLAHILFGRSAEDLTPFQAIQLAQASAMLLGGGNSLDMLNNTRRLIGVDQLSFKEGDSDDLASSRLVLGKYITDNILVDVEQGLGATSGAVSVEVELTRNLSLESTIDAEGKQGVRFNWKWDY